MPPSFSRNRLSIAPQQFRRVAIAALLAFAAVIVTGGAVRLSGSGLGCPDWPSCYNHRFTAQVSIHPMIEFINRGITVAVVVVAGATVVAALLREPRRRDLVWLSFGLVAGIAGQVVLGGLVVLFKLNPYLVMAHFLFSLAIVADAVVLVERAGMTDDDAARPRKSLVGRELRLLGTFVAAGVALVVSVGTAVSGAGPHSGDPGTSISRVAVAFQQIAELHSTIAIFVVGLTLAGVLAFHYAKAPEPVLRRSRTLLELLAIQGALGYTQYFLHDNALIVGFHIAGATTVFVAATFFYLSLWGPAPAPPATSDPEAPALTAARTDAVGVTRSPRTAVPVRSSRMVGQ